MAVFFISQTKTKQEWSLALVASRDAYTHFIILRQAMNCTPSTLAFYEYTSGKFLEWIECSGITFLEELTTRYIRKYVAGLVQLGKKDTTIWDHARAIETMLLFWHAEGYIPQPVKFDMPKLAKKRLHVLNAEQRRIQTNNICI